MIYKLLEGELITRALRMGNIFSHGAGTLILSIHSENSPVTQTTPEPTLLTHWGRVTHICVSKLTIIASDNGLSPDRRQAIIRTNAGILLIGPMGTNVSEILIEIQTFSLKKIRLKMSSAKCCTFRLGLNVLMSAKIRAWISNYIHC